MQSRLYWALLGAFLLGTLACTDKNQKAATKIRIQGSTTVNPVMTLVAEHLREAKGWKVVVDTTGGSSAGITATGEGTVDIGMSSKPLSTKDRKRYPTLMEHVIGYDAVAVVVSAAVYEGGVKSLSREQIQAIFTGKVMNWKAVGGPDLGIFIYNKEPGRGTRAVFERFVYKGQEAPEISLANYAEVGGNEETRQKIESHGSAIGQLSAAWAEKREKLRIVEIVTEEGRWLPTADNLRSRKYPMFRALRLLTKGTPTKAVAAVVQYSQSVEGRKLVRKVGYLPSNDGA